MDYRDAGEQRYQRQILAELGVGCARLSRSGSLEDGPAAMDPLLATPASATRVAPP